MWGLSRHVWTTHECGKQLGCPKGSPAANQWNLQWQFNEVQIRMWFGESTHTNIHVNSNIPHRECQDSSYGTNVCQALELTTASEPITLFLVIAKSARTRHIKYSSTTEHKDCANSHVYVLCFTAHNDHRSTEFLFDCIIPHQYYTRVFGMCPNLALNQCREWSLNYAPSRTLFGLPIRQSSPSMTHTPWDFQHWSHCWCPAGFLYV